MTDLTPAEELFAQYVAANEEASVDFDAWVASYPGSANELRALHDRWSRFEKVFEDLGVAPDGLDPRDADLLQRLAGGARAGESLRRREEIGHGGMGRVYRVFDPDLGRELALKVAREDEEESETTRRRKARRFLQEARMTGRLQHPGIVAVHQLGMDAKGRVFYTMPLVEGDDLETLLRSGERASAAERVRVVGYLLRVCETMAYAHEQGVLHGDLKPSNIRIGRFGEVTVMDWGLAESLGNAELSENGGQQPPLHEAGVERTRLTGTPAYLAPERVRAPRCVADARADVYAVGAILYRSLAGRAPHADALAGVRDLEQLSAVLKDAPAPLTSLAPSAPAELVAICEKAMAPLEGRYRTMSDLAGDLRAHLEGRVVRAHATGPLVELKKWVGRNRAAAALLFAFVVSLGVGLTVSAVLFVRAARAKERVLRLADLRRHGELVDEAETLWPAAPETVKPLEDWLQRARSLEERLVTHRATLAELRLGGREASGSWTFVDAESQWHHDTLQSLVLELEGLSDARTGLITEVTRRLDFARTVDERTRSGDAARNAWTEAAQAIAAHPPYRGFQIEPQLGLFPLGPDPLSGLWEFAHVESGSVPTRSSDGTLAIEPESAVVLVLVPGGRFWMGAQSRDEAGPNFDAAAFGNEGPPHEVDVSPFLLSKYELTQAQWLRMAGTNPSTHAPDSSSAPINALHPVETISRSDAARQLRRRGLDLPTEAQWEYAARAGTSSPWWTGFDAQELRGAVNLADQSVIRAGSEWPQIETWLDDGYYRHAPVDTLRANPFGLHHVLGNVWEWCRDDFSSYESVGGAQENPGATTGKDASPARPVGRGGGYVNNAAYSRVSLRDSRPDAPHLLFGVRPARRVR